MTLRTSTHGYAFLLLFVSVTLACGEKTVTNRRTGGGAGQGQATAIKAPTGSPPKFQKSTGEQDAVSHTFGALRWDAPTGFAFQSKEQVGMERRARIKGKASERAQSAAKILCRDIAVIPDDPQAGQPPSLLVVWRSHLNPNAIREFSEEMLALSLDLRCELQVRLTANKSAGLVASQLSLRWQPFPESLAASQATEAYTGTDNFSGAADLPVMLLERIHPGQALGSTWSTIPITDERKIQLGQRAKDLDQLTAQSSEISCSQADAVTEATWSVQAPWLSAMVFHDAPSFSPQQNSRELCKKVHTQWNAERKSLVLKGPCAAFQSADCQIDMQWKDHQDADYFASKRFFLKSAQPSVPINNSGNNSDTTATGSGGSGDGKSMEEQSVSQIPAHDQNPARGDGIRFVRFDSRRQTAPNKILGPGGAREP